MNLKKTFINLLAISVFIIASLLYFNPVLSGKQIKQSDITQFAGMAKTIVDFRKEHKKEPYWLDNAFSGMPAYQVSAYFPNDFVKYIDNALRFLPRPADYLFLYFLGFFVLLSVLKIDKKLAILGALAFGFSTYLIIIFGAGHNAKAHAIAYIPMVLAGVMLIFQKRYLPGFILSSVAMMLEVYSNHPQMTYYLGFTLLIFVIIEFVKAIKSKTIPKFAKQSAVFLLAMVLGIGANSTRLLSMKEYADYSTRGKSELTINTDGTPKKQTSGLDKTYITEYSYGVLETFNLMIPNFMGGGTIQELDETSNFYQVLKEKIEPRKAKEYAKNAPTYWGKQPFVEAPAYIGAIVFLLFFIGVFMVKGKLKYWLVASTIFSIAMSWGKNMPFLTNFFIDYVPLYNKFRAVSSIQIIAEICVPLLGILGLSKLFSSKEKVENKEKGLKKALFTTSGLILAGFILANVTSTFQGTYDAQYNQAPELIDALISDRKSMLLNDSLRSITLVLLSGVILWLFLKKKVKKNIAIATLGVLVLFDLISVDIKYVNKEDFVTKRKIKNPFTPTQADEEIMQDKSHYRVANLTGNPMNEGRTSYFHKSIGGYHAAKMKRYQELFDYQMSKNNIEVLNMLNTKYIITGANQAQLNDEANGNAWFVNKVKIVNSANEELLALSDIKTKEEAVIQKKDQSKKQIEFKKDSTASIELVKHSLNNLVYKCKSAEKQYIVFSEIYYKDGWNAYVNGKLTPHYQVNYVLRGMPIDAGKHTIEFKFEPTVIKRGNIITLACYILLIIIPLSWFFVKKKKNEKT